MNYRKTKLFKYYNATYKNVEDLFMFGTFHPSIDINLKYLHLCYVKLYVYHNKLHENDCPSFMHTFISASFITKISAIMSVLTSFIYGMKK